MPDKELLFGWCTTGHHKDCRAAYPDEWAKVNMICSCGCHKKDVSE